MREDHHLQAGGPPPAGAPSPAAAQTLQQRAPKLQRPTRAPLPSLPQIQIVHGTGFQGKAAEWVDAIHRSPLRTCKTVSTAVSNSDSELTEENKVRAALPVSGVRIGRD